jgi:hypothetical protein
MPDSLGRTDLGSLESQSWGQARGAKTLPPDDAAPMLEVAASDRNA